MIEEERFEEPDSPAQPEPRATVGAAGLEHSNVDAWFQPIGDKERKRKRRLGTRVMRHLQASGRQVVVVDLPYPEERHAYVEERFPGRRERAVDSLDRQIQQLDLEFIDLSHSLPEARYYRDYHHLNEEGQRQIQATLASELGR